MSPAFRLAPAPSDYERHGSRLAAQAVAFVSLLGT